MASTIDTLCRQCDMHCGITVHLEGGVPGKITGLKNHPANRGAVCTKGRAAAQWVTHPDRIRQPLKRMADGSFSSISYPAALEEIAGKMERIKETFGAEAVAVWIGEALGFVNQPEYARRFIHGFGSPHYFSADSVCFSSVFIAYHLVKGYWGSFPDFENANFILLWGVNPTVSYPTFMQAIQRARKKGAHLAVIDPRRSETADLADTFIRLRQGTDGALAWGLANRLIQRGRYDHDFVRDHASGFQSYADYAAGFPPGRVADICGIPERVVEDLAGMMDGARPKISQLTGISLEHQTNGVNTIRSIACLSGLCGAEDVEGGELWPREMKKNHLRTPAPGTKTPPIGTKTYPLLHRFCGQNHSLSAMDHMLGEKDPPLRGLIMSGANPVLTNPNAAKVKKALSSLDLLVTRELFHTRTSDLSHYIIPNASFLERSELFYYAGSQRVGLSNKAFEVPGVKDDYTFWRDLAKALGLPGTLFPWKDEEAVNRFILEPSGITLEALKAAPGGITFAPPQYRKYRTTPFPTASGTYEFTCQNPVPGLPALPEFEMPPHLVRPDPDFPLILMTGARKRHMFNSRYLNIPSLAGESAVPHAEIHPGDAGGLKTGDRVRVVSRIGEIDLAVRITDKGYLRPGTIQITHGWDQANVNLLVDDTVLDPVSGFPDMKTVPVRLEPLDG